jgi:hypothetical protein
VAVDVKDADDVGVTVGEGVGVIVKVGVIVGVELGASGEAVEVTPGVQVAVAAGGGGEEGGADGTVDLLHEATDNTRMRIRNRRNCGFEDRWVVIRASRSTRDRA